MTLHAPGRRLRLRARLTLAFGLGGVILATLVSLVTYGIVRNNLIDRAQDDAIDAFNRKLPRLNERIGDDTPVEDVRQQLINFSAGSRALIRLGLPETGETDWVGTDPNNFGRENVNDALLAAVDDPLNPQASRMRYAIRDEPVLVLGSAVERTGSVYFEAVSLQDIDDTLSSLALTLLAASTVTTVAAVGLGIWASRRVLQPLTDVSHAAHAIADGDLDTRLQAEDDADLEPLVESFNDMAQALQERIERDARFVSDVSHELRSPLMTVMTAVEVLKTREEELDERSQTALTLLSEDLERFRALVEDLLEISRFEAGGASLDHEQFGIAEFVRQAVAQTGHHDVPVDLGDVNNQVIEGDKRRLARVIANLLDNAEKYGGGPTALSLDIVGQNLLLAVEDAGPGVPPEERALIFDRFARGSEGGRRGFGSGTGLGLALVAEHVRLHGGHAWVEDRTDGQPGARFVVSIPGVRS